ncbi:I-set domain containing protein [Trichuris trichiura]|uniref:I-set domain containing protein n=1 Tax=Trichuris trichiura TaxID=36087 RepID=A0A077Z4T7_TRITR|nr:I-set domain containing protein [Trichuris trichiura]
MPFKRPLGASVANQHPPYFIRPLQNKRVVAGQQVVLECQLEGQPDPVIKWLKDGQNVTNCPDYQLTQEGNKVKLVIPSVQTSDSGRFDCQALNAAGSKSSSCILIVAPTVPDLGGARFGAVPSPAPPPTPVGPAAPYFVKELKHQLLKIGSTVSFECRVTGIPPPQVSWSKDGKQLQPSSKMEYDTENGICVLTISLLLAEDIGEYRCTAVNVHGQASTAASILYKDQYNDWLAEEQMKITREKKRNVLEELDNVVQQPRKQKGTFYTPQSQRMLNMLYSKDNGVVPEVPTLKAREAPQVVRPLRPVSVQEGQDAELSCQIKGNPTPKVRWFKNSTPLTPSQRISISARGTTHSLSIRMVLPEDAAKYSLMAENGFGKLEQVTNLIIIEKPGSGRNSIYS